MTVIAELSLDPEAFPLGTISMQDPEMHIELERVVPSQAVVFPFFWARGGDFEAFEAHVRSLDAVEELVALEAIDDQVLYKVRWGADVENFVLSLVESEAVILEAHGNEQWFFRLRFPDHNGLTQFHNYCQDQDIPFKLERVYTLASPEASTYHFGLTPEQREALVLAVDMGYFRVPRGCSLSDIAAELDISEQSASERVRRAVDRVTSKVILPRSASDLDTE